MSFWDRIIEERIARAAREGAFDHLPGKGQPHPLESNPHQDPAWGLAWHLLKSNGFTLPWIETRREIEDGIAQARLALTRAARRRAEGGASNGQEADWQQALAAFRQQVADLNRRILDFNLAAPLDRFHLLPVDGEAEISRLIQGVKNGEI